MQPDRPFFRPQTSDAGKSPEKKMIVQRLSTSQENHLLLPKEPRHSGTATPTADKSAFKYGADPRPFSSQEPDPDPDANSAKSRFSSFAKVQPAAQPASPSAFASKAPQPSAKPASPSWRSSSPFRKDLQITDEEFLLLRDFIYQQCGIFIAENRKYLVENRLSNRIKDLNLKSYSEYYNFLRFDNSRRQELTKLFEVVTTNETSFFRNPPQLEVFQRIVLAQAIEQARASGQKNAYLVGRLFHRRRTIYSAIILHETLKSDIGSWDIKNYGQ